MMNNNYEILPDDYSSYDILFKIIVIGNSGVGKTCLSIRATKGTFENNHLTTVGFEFFSFNLKVNEKVIKLQIWDTCGQENYRSLISNFYRNATLAIIVYAVDDKKSFDSIESWIRDLKQNSSPNIKLFMIGNKTDLVEERVVSYEKAKKLNDEYQFDSYIETSAKTGLNVQELFVEVAKITYNEYIKLRTNDELNTNQSISIQLAKNKEKGCCK